MHGAAGRLEEVKEPPVPHKLDKQAGDKRPRIGGVTVLAIIAPHWDGAGALELCGWKAQEYNEQHQCIFKEKIGGNRNGKKRYT